MTYATLPFIRMPVSSCNLSAQDLGTDMSYIPDFEELPIYSNLSISPLFSSLLLRVPADEGHTAISMLHIHLLHTLKSAASSLTIPDKTTHADITHNYHELAVLAGLRWRLGGNPMLPFHLAALEAMQVGLERGEAWTDI